MRCLKDVQSKYSSCNLLVGTKIDLFMKYAEIRWPNSIIIIIISVDP